MKKTVLLRVTMILLASLAIQYAIAGNNLCFSNDECMNMNVFECITNPIKCFKCIIEKIKELAERLQCLLQSYEVVRADTDTLAGYVAAVNQQIKYLWEEVETVKESYTSKKEFEEKTQKFNRGLSNLQGDLEKIRETVKKISADLTAVQTNQEDLNKTINSISQSIAGIYNEIENVKGSYVSKQELRAESQKFTAELSILQGNLENIAKSVQRISADFTTILTYQQELDKTINSIREELTGRIAEINQHIKYLLEELEIVKQSYTSKEEFEEKAHKFDRELSNLQGNLEKVTERLELIEKPVAELTRLKAQIERQIERAEQQILIMENYRNRIDGMDAKIHKLETTLARHDRQIKTNKTIMWFLAIGVVVALTSQK